MTQNKPVRCPWVELNKPDYVAYHDEEWGMPFRDDRRWFEFLILESAQAGLSWYTVLRKRPNYKKAFAEYDPRKVARYTPTEIQNLLKDPGIIRNRLKVEAAVNNARCFLEIQAAFGSFNTYIWRFVGNRPRVNRLKCIDDYPTTSPEAEALSKDLRQRGFKFIGPTICYALMQATGLVNDHTLDCFRRQAIINTYSGNHWMDH